MPRKLRTLLDWPTWDPRPRRGFGSWWSIGLGIGLVLAGLGATAATAPCDEFHAAVELSGSDARLAGWLAACEADLGAGRASLLLDLVLIAGYVLLLSSIVRRWWPLYRAPRLRALAGALVLVPVAAGALDVVENGLVLLGLRVEGGRFDYPDHLALPITVATVAWTKFLALTVALLAAIMASMLAFARRHEPSDRPPAGSPLPPPVVDDPPGAFGVCCSGGGIRAAAFSIGALERLEQAGVMPRARYLTAVSGGAYAATAWRLLKADDPVRPAAPDVVRWLQEQIPGSPAGRHRFLRNGPGGLGRSVFAAIVYIAFNLVVLAALVLAVAWPIGRLVGSRAVQPVLRALGDLPERIDVPAELWLPGLIVTGAGGVVLAVSALPSWKVAALWRVAAGLAVIGLALEVLLVGVPLAMVLAGGWLHGGTASGRATVVGTGALAGVAGAVWRLARPVVSRLTAMAPKLGGLLLVLAVVIWGGKVATDAALGTGLFRSPWTWAAVTLAFALVYLFVGITFPTLHRIYRKRLRRTFGLARRGGTVYAPDEPDQLSWDRMPPDAPELVLCCAQQRTGIAPGGLPAETFTISRRHVRMGDTVVATSQYLERLHPDLATERYVSSWIATTGAAFASAMGRLSKGSTNALLAALNVDLGIWLPNPRLVADPSVRFAKVRFGYLFKEILGWYDPLDRYVFVADGGHWENLGLVELLRRRCGLIVCFDAAGDTGGTFTTLMQAVELAGLELPDVVGSIDVTELERLRGKGGAMPGGVLATLRVTYRNPDGTTSTGTILFAKAQLAGNLDIALRRFAKADPRFPDYSTGDQFLSDAQFAALVDLGRAAGTAVVDELATLPPP